MEATKSQILKIVKRIPVGYYFGKNIPVTLDEVGGTSYCSLNGPRIVISMKNVQEAVSQIDDDFDEEVCERIIRSLIYHEVSHAMLTPQLAHQFLKDIDYDTFKYRDREVKEYGIDNYRKARQIFNIAEDQRIENLTKNIYKGIDYNELLGYLAPSIEGCSSPLTHSDLDLFFELMRYGKIPPEVEEVLDENPNRINEIFRCRGYIVRKYLTAQSNYYGVESYVKSILALYVDFIDLVRTAREFFNIVPGESPDEDCSDQSQIIRNNFLLDPWSDYNDPFKSHNTNSRARKFPRYTDILRKRESKDPQTLFKEMISRDSKSLIDESLKNKLKEILLVTAKTSARQSSAINSYSGVFDPRQVVREDCKYFLFRGNQGSCKLNNKLRLNLFIDRSGSFSSSESKVNTLLNSLYDLRNLDSRFSFTLTTIGEGLREEDLEKFQKFYAHDGTFLSPDAFEIFKRKQDSRSVNLNLVLIDGYAWELKGYDGKNYEYCAGAFNSRNTVVITDRSNSKAFETYAPLAKLKICRDYAEVLLDEIISSLKRVMPLLS